MGGDFSMVKKTYWSAGMVNDLGASRYKVQLDIALLPSGKDL